MGMEWMILCCSFALLCFCLRGWGSAEMIDTVGGGDKHLFVWRCSIGTIFSLLWLCLGNEDGLTTSGDRSSDSWTERYCDLCRRS